VRWAKLKSFTSIFLDFCLKMAHFGCIFCHARDFFCSSRGGAWPKWPNGKYATARIIDITKVTLTLEKPDFERLLLLLSGTETSFSTLVELTATF